MADERAVVGCLTGMAVGDALGLPYEGLSPERAGKIFPDTERYHFLFSRGMFSDDTEHACMTAQALLAAGGDPARFSRSLAWRLRWWLLGCPLGAGKATLLGCLRLWLGFNPMRSGVYSAGNGPCMRAPILGLALGDRREQLAEFIRRSTRMTHTDPKAEEAARFIAVATHLSASGWESPAQIALKLLAAFPSDGIWVDRIGMALGSAEACQPTEEFAADLGLRQGVTGYVLHTVPVVIQAWMRFPTDYPSAVRSVIRCGGDTDTMAALVGGIVGARVGVGGIPERWRAGLAEWPRNLRWIGRLGRELAAGTTEDRPRRTIPLNPIGLIARNMVFAGAVFAHVLRRVLPPF